MTDPIKLLLILALAVVGFLNGFLLYSKTPPLWFNPVIGLLVPIALVYLAAIVAAVRGKPALAETEVVQSEAMYWEYHPEWQAWWLMVPESGTSANKGYGPFNTELEVQIAAEAYGVPFTRAFK